MRPWLAWSLFVLAAAAARPAAADTALNGGVIKISLYIPEDNGEDGKAQSQDQDDYQLVNDPAMSLDMRRYFNAARCECDKQSPGDPAAETSQLFMLKLSYATMPAGDPGDVALDLFAGDRCDEASVDPTVIGKRCSMLAGLNANDLDDNNHVVFAQVGDLVAPGTDDGTATGMANACNTAVTSSAAVVLSGASNRFIESGAAFTVPFDLNPPDMPTALTPAGLDETIRISWDAPSTRPEYYQALCIRTDGKPAHSLSGATTPNATHSPQFDSTESLCGIAPVEPVAGTVAGETAEPDPLPAPLKILDPNYVCGQSEGATSSIDLKGLENGVSYRVVVLAIDSAGNYDAVFLPHPVSPVPSIDFWEDANDENPDVGGGFCVAQVGRGGSGAGALMVLAAVAIAIRRRRRRVGAGGGSAALLGLGLLALAPASARAQSYDPYWIDSEASSTARVDQPNWHLGLRLGPYHPSVDAGFDSDPGPFRRMFGPGYNLVPQLDLHRLWTVASLQLGVGVSGGYYSKSADAYQVGSVVTDNPRPRAEGATNTFTMIPLSVTGIARLAVLDDRWGIPVVPYVRGGVAYNVWWVRTATGDLAMTDCDTCHDKALGASAGLVGAVGIAIRGERLDGEASHSMRNGGVEHAGFYAELETSWVDGFGNAKRLSLGDTTWYAGVDFEF